jgi:hypothetical protein
MSNKSRLTAYLAFEGDGSSTTLAVNFITAPLSLVPQSGGELSASFSLAAALPSAVINPQCSGGLGVTVSLGLLGAVTFTFTGGPPAANTAYLIAMDLLF